MPNLNDAGNRNFMHVCEVRLRKDHRGRRSHFRCAPIRSLVVWRAERNQQRNRICAALQPLRGRYDSRLR
jgi:hypothetical protein